MRVLHVIPAIAARYGGPSVVAVDTARALRAAGHEVLIATTDADGPTRLRVPVGRPSTWEGLPVMFFSRVASEAFKWSPRLASWLASCVANFDVVDIHAVFSHSSLAAGQACRRNAVPYVVRPHGALDPWSLGRKPWQKRALMTVGARALLNGAACVQYTTAEEQRLAESALPWLSHGAVVSLGVDEAWFLPGNRSDSAHPYVLVMSRLDAKKGLELLIEAFHTVTASGSLSPWALTIAGDGDPAYVATLRRLAARGPSARRITFTGWVSGEAKRALVRGAALFASPSEQENFGLSLVEAMAAGVPALVAPGVNLAFEVTAARAGWVVARDPSAWCDALAGVLADGRELDVRGRGARELASRYRWQTSAEQLIALYDRVRHPENVW